MAAINQRRVLLSALAGFAVWAIWSGVLNFAVLASRYPMEQEAGHLLKNQPYSLYLGSWFLVIFMLSLIAAQFYAWARATLGPGTRTALTVGSVFALAVALPIEVTTSRFTIDHTFTICWLGDLVVGTVLATQVAGWLYRD